MLFITTTEIFVLFDVKVDEAFGGNHGRTWKQGVFEKIVM